MKNLKGGMKNSNTPFGKNKSKVADSAATASAEKKGKKGNPFKKKK